MSGLCASMEARTWSTMVVMRPREQSPFDVVDTLWLTGAAAGIADPPTARTRAAAAVTSSRFIVAVVDVVLSNESSQNSRTSFADNFEIERGNRPK